MRHTVRFLGKQANHCPECKTMLDAASPVRNDERLIPKAGDVTMCLSCGVFLMFGKTLELLLLTKEDIDNIHKRQPELICHLMQMREAFDMLNAQRSNMN